MKIPCILLFPTVLLLSACANQEKPCEDILEVKKQEQQCAQWRKQMQSTGHPQQALTAKKRYEQACLNLRYYRDDYDTICKKGQKPIGESADQSKHN